MVFFPCHKKTSYTYCINTVLKGPSHRLRELPETIKNLEQQIFMDQTKPTYFIFIRFLWSIILNDTQPVWGLEDS